MILTAGKYSDVRATAQAKPTRGVQTSRRVPGLFIPTLSGNKDCLKEWFWRELKEGGWLHAYLQREKASTPRAVRRIARLMHGFQQNNKSDFQRKATIPTKLYHRWKDVDEHFFDDDANLRSLKRDNPEVCVYVGPRQLPTTRLRVRYGANTKMEDGGLKMAKAENGAADVTVPSSILHPPSSPPKP